jgi:hypothetical protein
MKYTSKLLFAVILITAFAACKKVADLPFYKNGNAPTLTASSTTVAAIPADSSKPALTLSWTSPGYATDSANMKYVIQIDSAGGNFSNSSSRTVLKSLSTTFTASELNSILLSYGYAFGVPYDMDIRVLSSYANNNEQYTSNKLAIKMTPYRVPPIGEPPSSNTLFIVGSATAGGWGNPVPTPAQQFTRIDSVTYQGTFFLNGGGQYLLLPVNGDWSHKFNVADGSVAGLAAGGSFGADLGNANIPGPANTGMYKITVDFQHGKFTVAPVGSYGLLYVPGDYQGWTPATATTLGSPKNDGSYDGYVNIPAGGTYEFKLNTTPDWSNSFGDGGSGTLSSSGGNMKVPGAGYYHIVANTNDKTWSATSTTWGVIGSFAPSNWGSDIDMTYSTANNNWTATITTVAGDQFKFRGNHDWGLNYGETGGTGSLSAGGDNIGDASKNFAVPAGTHTITLFLNNSGYYTYLIQ